MGFNSGFKELMDLASTAVSGTSVYASGLMDLASPAASQAAVYASGLKVTFFCPQWCYLRYPLSSCLQVCL